MLASPRSRPLDLDLSKIPKRPLKSSQRSLASAWLIPAAPPYKLYVGQPIGSGGFGTVYQGELDNKKIALKKLRVNTKTEDIVWGSLLSELRAVCLKHANIVQVIGAVMYQSTPCLVMEYAGDHNLQDVIDDKEQKIPLSRRVQISSAIVSGLEYIHARSVTHLDLKPANLIMKNEFSCKIGDFGCSLKVDDDPDGDVRSTFYLTGTHAYKAPELLLGEFPTVQADIYSLGICMWQMLTREEPYKGEDPHLVIFGIATDSIRPRLPEDGVTNTDVAYLHLFQKCWKGLPGHRPRASEIQTLLKDIDN